MREVVEGMGSGVVGLQVSHLLSLGISSPWEGKSLQSQQGPKIPKHQNYKTKRHDEYTLLSHLPAHTAFSLSRASIFFTTPLTKRKPGAKSTRLGTSLVGQWLRICLPMQGTPVRALVQEDPTCHGATQPLRHNY